MSAVLSEADRSLAAGFAGAVTMEDEPVKAKTFANIYADNACILVQDFQAGESDAGVLLDAYLHSGGVRTKISVSLRLPPSKALELATALFQSASRLIAAQDAKEGVKA